VVIIIPKLGAAKILFNDNLEFKVRKISNKK